MRPVLRFFASLSTRSLLLGIFVLYVVTHLPNLLGLPVFADEAIYIRWAQLIIDEPGRYAFFPLNDGKTPLYIWLLVPFQFLFDDQLFAARFFSVLVGLFQVWASVMVVRKLGGSQFAQVCTALFVTILPFWYFHHRLALMDGLLTLFLTLTLYSLLHVLQSVSLPRKVKLAEVHSLMSPTWFLLSGLALGAALWTKLPAVLFAPAIGVLAFISKTTWREYLARLFVGGLVFAAGLLVFALLKLHPAFSQLFSRGGDFLFPVTQVLLEGKWRETLPSFPTYLNYFSSYLTPAVLILTLFGTLYKNDKQRTIFLLLLGALAFTAPVAVLGKVVYPRYLLPAALFVTPAAALAFQVLHEAVKKTTAAFSWKKLLYLWVIFSIILTSGQFIHASLRTPDQTPFVSADRTQYLTEWSSGHGIAQVSNKIQQVAQTQSVAVATEGYFGTLPDGVLLYLHRRPTQNIWVEGIGQPVGGIPKTFRERAQQYDHVWLVVNSHRLNLKLDQALLLEEYCRPFAAPCLQVWDITSLVSPTDTQ